MGGIADMDGAEYAAYVKKCDARSSAELRMRRELCGITIGELADALGVGLNTAKRWENPAKGMPPSPRAWEYVDDAYAKLVAAVDAAVEQADEISEELGEPQRIVVAYRRGNGQTRGLETVARANAAARASAIALMALGYEVSAEWTDEGAALLASRAR